MTCIEEENMKLMKKGFALFILSAFVLFSLLASAVLAKENTPGSAQAVDWQAAKDPWFTRYIQHQIDPMLSVGNYNSMAFSPIDHLPYISYNDTDHEYLMLASPESAGNGNCGANGDWLCQVVDGDGLNGHSSDNVGAFTSLAFWVNGGMNGTWKLGISYYDLTIFGLRYAVYSCVASNCTWSYSTIATGLGTDVVGWYTSLRFDSGGEPHIAYYESNTEGYDHLHHATYIGGGTGNCGPFNNWECMTVDSGDGVGQYASLDISYDGKVYIAYYAQGTGDFRYAYDTGLGNCGTGNAWYCQTIDSVDDVGASASLIAPQSTGDIFRVAYYDITHHALKYAYSGMGVAGNCGPGNSWQCNRVDDMDISLPAGVSLKLDQNGYPMIAYQHTGSTLGSLSIARPYLAYGNLEMGNCGDVPPGYLFQYWQCTSLDNANALTGVGDYISLAFDSNGRGAIAYSELDDFYDNFNLKFAYQRATVYLPVLIK
jgi:hypothetical protein